MSLAKKALSSVFWTAVLLAILLGSDQLLLRVPMELPVLTEVQRFYLDFRSRLGAPAQDQVAEIIEAKPAPAETPEDDSPLPNAAPARYLYQDGEGALQFADTLEEIPRAFRTSAQVLQR